MDEKPFPLGRWWTTVALVREVPPACEAPPAREAPPAAEAPRFRRAPRVATRRSRRPRPWHASPLPTPHRAWPARSLLLFLAASCLLTGAHALARGLVVVSIHPYASLVEQVVGDHADVVQLLPSGASPHSFDPTPTQATALAKADLIVMNGSVDGWLDRLIRSTAPTVPVLVALNELRFTPVSGEDGDDAHAGDDHGDGGEASDEAAGHEHVGANPHVWLDPVLMAQLVPSIAVMMAQADPAYADAYTANAAALSQRLLRLDADLRRELAPVRHAPFVPFHDAWPYFARRYGLDLVVTIEPFPGREPSARYVAETVATIRASGATVIFYEPQLGRRPAEVVAEAAGVGLAEIDPLGTDEQSYEELLRANAATVLRALSAP